MLNRNGELGDEQRCLELLSKDPRVDWNIRDSYAGETPLLYCLKEGKAGMAKMIINNTHVDLNAQNNDGEYPETIAR